MARQSPHQLKVYTESVSTPAPIAPDVSPALERLCETFGQLTGWSLAARLPNDHRPAARLNPPGPTNAEMGTAMPSAFGPLVLEPVQRSADRSVARIEPSLVKSHALALDEFVGRYYQMLEAMTEGQAELAAGVPVTRHREQPQYLAAQLRAILKAAAEATSCVAAALYMLDEGTSQLHLRACFGMEPEQLAQPARPLADAYADLESLLGHAVVLDDPDVFDYWNAPHKFASAVCVPVSSPSVPLGTLWVFSDLTRDFSSVETNLLEIIAGRLAAELEREVLLEVSLANDDYRRRYRALSQSVADMLPMAKPEICGFEIAGRVSCAGSQSPSAMYDTFAVRADRHGTMLIDAAASGAAAPLVISSIRSAAHRQRADGILSAIEQTFLCLSPGDWEADVALVTVDEKSKSVTLSGAGEITAIRCWGKSAIDVLPPLGTRLGEPEQKKFPSRNISLTDGQGLLLLNRAAALALEKENGKMASRLAELLDGCERLKADEILSVLEDEILAGAENQDKTDTPGMLLIRESQD